jgi:hypothetical protein
MRGAVIYTLSAALQGRTDIRDHAVQQTNFLSYPHGDRQQCTEGGDVVGSQQSPARWSWRARCSPAGHGNWRTRSKR